MLRRARTIILLLFLGVIVNIAVAWGLAARRSNNQASVSQDLQWPESVPQGWPPAPHEVDKYNTSGFAITRADAWGNPPNEERAVSWMYLYSYLHFEVGWPRLSLQWCIHDDMEHLTGTLDYWPNRADDIWQSGIDPPGWFINQDLWRFQRRLPVRPIWPGFLINTLFYAIILWLLFCGPGKVRRFIRIRRSRCPKCGYPIGDSPNCTECGASLAQQKFMAPT